MDSRDEERAPKISISSWRCQPGACTAERSTSPAQTSSQWLTQISTRKIARMELRSPHRAAVRTRLPQHRRAQVQVGQPLWDLDAWRIHLVQMAFGPALELEQHLETLRQRKNVQQLDAPCAVGDGVAAEKLQKGGGQS